MNRFEELSKKKSHLAVLGLNTEGIRYALEFSQRFSTFMYDFNLKGAIRTEAFLAERGMNTPNSIAQLELVHAESDLRAAGVYYLNGLSGSVMDWDSIKRNASIIGKSLNVGDWIVLGPHIDPDLAEVVLLEILERNSGLKMGEGFELAFHPSVINKHNFNNMGNEMKMSHNLIIDHVEKLFRLSRNDEFGTAQINYQNLDSELRRIRSKVEELWIPMLNEMTKETFKEFVELSINKNFLDVYNHLRLSTESKVNWKRFFELLPALGLKQDFIEILNAKDRFRVAI